ncbi:MAG: TolC family protein [Thermodesulfobacteriota bacterium]
MKRLRVFTTLFLILMLWADPTPSASSEAIPAPHAGGYSLSDLYETALRTSEKIKLSEEELTLSKLDREKALSVLLPALSTFGDYTRYSEQKNYKDAVIQPESSIAYGIGAGQSFTLNGKEMIALKIADQNIEKRNLDLYSAKEEYLLAVASAYFTVLKGQRRLEIAQANLERLTTQRNAVSVKLKLEEVPKTAMFRADAELSKAKADRVLAENRLAFSKSVLSRVAGIPENYSLIEPRMNPHSDASHTLNELKTVGLFARSELKAFEIQKAVAENTIRFTKSDYWPKISIQGEYLRYDQSPAIVSLPEDSLSLSLKLNFLLYDGGLRNAQIKDALIQKKKVDLASEGKSKEINIEIEDAYLDMMTQKNILQSLKDQLKSAEENYEAVRRQFDHGLSDIVDLIDANTLLVTSQRQVSEAEYDLLLAQLKLQRAKGVFLKEVLAEMNKNG